MTGAPETDQHQAVSSEDPRALLARWANSSDEWVRLLVSEVIASGRPVGESTIDHAYQLFRQEKAVDARTLPAVDHLDVEPPQDETAPPLAIVRLSDIRGVNALVPGAVIEPHEGLTILYGENGTGKTGYSRIFKALANSRTADEILGNIASETEEVQEASLDFTVGGETESIEWTGQRGISPFTRMSIFDSPSVTTHVDQDLDYVYVPAALALFNHVIAAIQGVSARIDDATSTLASSASVLLGRFPKDSSVYPTIETLGASTDLETLAIKRSDDPKIDEKVDGLAQTVAALKTNTIGTQITAHKRDQRVLEQALGATITLLDFDAQAYNSTLAKRRALAADYEAFRTELFAAADLPAKPDETWEAFVEAGERYKQHLLGVEAHDADRCLYCRQALTDPARDLLAKYSTYLEDKISSDIRETDQLLATAKDSIAEIAHSETDGFLQECETRDDAPSFLASVKAIEAARSLIAGATGKAHPIEPDASTELAGHKSTVGEALKAADADIVALEKQSKNRADALATKQTELAETTAAAELSRSWSSIELQVTNAKEADRLRILKRALSGLSRNVTALSKAASDQLVNQSFDALFLEECEALRAPQLKIQFVGREGKAQRRKVLNGRHKPSKVLSEGEQKVLALADFLAEARLAGITAPVIFDDPVSSLDHRRISEVAQRIARLADTSQVIVFTHDVLFATSLLGLFEKSKRCSYFQVTDEGGAGRVARATGPRWDTLKGIRSKINSTIEAAKQEDGEARDALVRTGYGWIRSWCEVFTETELLQRVAQRYQPNVSITNLSKINTTALGELIPKITEVFDAACRYIDGHSQPLPTLGVAPTLSGLEAHWQELQDLKSKHDGKQ